jgi:hypothetical protein
MKSEINDIKVIHYTDSSGFDILEPYWNDLLSKTPVDDPFLTFEWQSTWWKHYGAELKLWLLAAWQDDRPVGIIPLMSKPKFKRGIKANVLHIIGWGDIDHGGLIIPEERLDVKQAFAKYLVEHDHDWDILQLDNFLDGCQNLDPFLNEFPRRKFISEIYQEAHQFYLPLVGTWEEYQKQLPERLRRTIKNRATSIAREMQGRISNLIGSQISKKDLDDFLETGMRGRYSHLYQLENDRQFHRSLLSSMGSKGWLGLNLLYLGNQPIAYRYGFIYHSHYYAWRTGYDPQFSEMSPGSFILSKTIEYYFKIGLEEFDFLRGDSWNKQQWTAQSRIYLNRRIIRRWRLPELIFSRLPAWKTKILKLFINQK